MTENLEPDRGSLSLLIQRCRNFLSDTTEMCMLVTEERMHDIEGLAYYLKALLSSVEMTSQSVLILIEQGRLWDADSLVRSVFEGTVKFAYLSYGDKADIQDRLQQYSVDLSQIARLKEHDRVSAFRDAVGGQLEAEWRGLVDLLLTTEEIDDLRNKYPRSMRRILEQRWSFHGIIEALAASGKGELSHITNLFINYGLSSHVLHQDADGVVAVWERGLREPHRREAVELAHAGRMISDLAVAMLIRYVMAILGMHPPDKKVFKRYAEISRRATAYGKRFTEVEYGGGRRDA